MGLCGLPKGGNLELVGYNAETGNTRDEGGLSKNFNDKITNRLISIRDIVKRRDSALLNKQESIRIERQECHFLGLVSACGS